VVTLNQKGLMPFESFVQIFQVIRKHARHQLTIKLDEIKLRRRSLFNANKIEEYREVVLQQMQVEEQVYLEISNIVCSKLDLTEE